MRRLLSALPLLLAVSCGTDESLFPATIEIEEVRVSARVGGQITGIHVSRGDMVTQGDLLVKMDETQYLLALAQAEASLSSAEAGLETLLEGTRSQQIISAAASAEAARAVSIQAETDLLRARELYLAGALSEQALQAAETASVAAASSYRSAAQGYALAAEGARSTEIRAAEAGVAAAEAGVEMARRNLEWTGVTAPVPGTVTGIDALTGENFPQGMTLLTVAPLDTVKVIFYIPQPLLSRVSPGDPVEVTATGEEPVAGTISTIASKAEFTPSSVETREGRTSLVYRVEGRLPNPGGIFRGGMPVDARLVELR
ncbi:MAG TPA: HlyD family efflux transporter periplasmic adaptor subunit [Candidatus Sabulitectum sp.]|nr:HlyD family efflux transporter periplasmic adaptor subunit [Candidatus Sabulitectum sp.]HPJ28319.1 HlyD family efflux transporter periplasmic adaptor subunit [Candidatus Sabulitectum sp.]HPR22441.1 HlyD family efflux transporter periplasmic adaptor subunit [Candidatus Sabulitectum sp.]